MKYYSNAQLHRGMDNMYQMERQARKKLEYAMAALKTIAEGDAGNTAESMPGEMGMIGENAETDAAGRVIEPARMTREEMIAAAKTALAELNTRKEW